MGNRETVGIVTILAGVLLMVGAVRGTWQRLFKDVVLGQSSSGSTSSTSSGTAGGVGAGVTLSAASQTGSGPQVGELTGGQTGVLV